MAIGDFVIRFPEYFDRAEPEITAKGFFADLVIESDGQEYQPVFYDLVRFGQEARDRLDADHPCYVEPNLVLVELVDRAHLQDAVSWLAKHGFTGLSVVKGDR